MEIRFRTRRLSRLFNSDRELRREYGAATARAIVTRLEVLNNAATLTQVSTAPPERRHSLSGQRRGQYAVDLVHPYRLIFEPEHSPLPRQADGGIDTDQVTAITIIEVVDYH